MSFTHAIMTGLSVLFFALPSQAAEKAGQSAYDRVMETKTIRCGYVLYPPAVVRDEKTGKLSGFAYDLMNRAGEDLGLKVEWTEEVGTGVMLEGLKTHRYDMICTPFWRNAERGVVADFSVPLYYSPMSVWVRKDDNRFGKDVETLNKTDVTLSVMDGTTLSVIAAQDFPNAKTMSVPQSSPFSDLMLNVSTKKADAVIIDDYLAKGFLKTNPGTLKTTGKPLRVYPNGFVYGIHDTALKTMIDSALIELQGSGYVDAVITKYEEFPKTFLRVQKPYRENAQ